MKKIRVHELAKELGKTSKELIEILAALKIEAKNHMSAIDKETSQLVKDLLAEEKKAALKVKEKTTVKKIIKKEKTGEKKEIDVSKTTAKEPAKKPAEKKEIIKEEKPVVSKPAPTPGEELIEEEKAPSKNVLSVAERISLRELSEKMNLAPAELIKDFLLQGYLITINQDVEYALAQKIATRFGFELEKKTAKKGPGVKVDETAYLPNPKNLKPRPPVVTIMGHVDHGKTKLLDAIRNSNVVATEAGNITQHIGAYLVKINDKKVVLLDTPGHEAFTALRARGAQATDIAILVVAADDGVMPQTIEAIDHAKAAGVPIIVAINKIDKPEANLQKVKQQLADLGLVSEDWGGQTVTVPISAKLNKGIDELLEMVLLVAEMQELKADPTCLATGVVIEAKLDRNRGPIATVLIKQGILKIGDVFWIGATFGKVRAIYDDRGSRLKEISPGLPGEILGSNSVPQAGEILRVVKDEKFAKETALKVAQKQSQEKLNKQYQVSLENLYSQLKAGEIQALNLILKADVQGSIEAIVQSLTGIKVADIKTNLLHAATGEINESDVLLAKASKAIIVGFNVGVNPQAKAVAEVELVEIKLYEIIYNFLDDIKLALEGMLKPEYEQVVIGRAEVRALFKSSKIGVIAGCYVLEGKMTRACGLRIFRNREKIFEGKLESLKRFKDDVREVTAGFECGVALASFNDFNQGDILEVLETREKRRKIPTT